MQAGNMPSYLLGKLLEPLRNFRDPTYRYREVSTRDGSDARSDWIPIEGNEHLDQQVHDGEWQSRQNSRTNQDHEETTFHRSPWQCINAYPMAIFWSLAVSTCVIMEGYDTILIGNFFAYPTFQQKYGHFVGVSKQAPSGYQLTAAWEAGVSQAAGVGAFFGVLINGHLVNIFGQKKVLLWALVLLSAFIFMTFSAPNIQTLAAGEFLCGLPWGVFATTAPAYASEVLPLELRIYLTSYTNMCFIIGQLIAAGVLKNLASRTDEWGYRIPFALQWTWPAFLLPLLFFAPESPWHLVRQQRLQEAESSLRRLQRASANIDPKRTLAKIIQTNHLEEQLSVGTTYWDCFRGFEFRRTEIACMTFAGQILSGSTFAYNASYFFEQVGLPTATTYTLNFLGTGVALVGTLLNWFLLMPYYGRRSIYIAGVGVMVVILLLIGLLSLLPSTYNISIIQALLTIVWTLVFQMSVGQLGWALPAEIGSTRLRQKTICLARNAYYIVGVIGGILEQYYMNPTAWNLRGYTSFIWCSSAFLVLVWSYFRLPETKGRDNEELDLLFSKKISARKFSITLVNTYNAKENNLLARHTSTPDVDQYELSSISSISSMSISSDHDHNHDTQPESRELQ